MGLDQGIVDAHVHIWTPDTERYPLAPGFTAEDMWTPSFTAEDLLSHCRPSGVDRINLVQMTWYGLDHSYILDVIASDPKRFCGTGMVPAVSDITLADQGDAMVALSRGGIHAFRVRGRSARPGINDGRSGWTTPGTRGCSRRAPSTTWPSASSSTRRTCRRWTGCVRGTPTRR